MKQILFLSILIFIVVFFIIIVSTNLNKKSKKLKGHNAFTINPLSGIYEELDKTKLFETVGVDNYLDVFNDVKSGNLDFGINGAFWWGEIDPVLYLLSSIPFVYTNDFIYKFINDDIGQELLNEIGEKHNMKIFIVGVTAVQICGWWKTVPEKIEDISGLKVRFTGLAKKVFENLGANVVDIDPSMLLEEFRDGDLDAVEWATAYDDLNMEFHTVTKNAMVPGWHEPGTILHIMINLDKWNSLCQNERILIEKTCDKLFRVQLYENYINQGSSIKELLNEGVEFTEFSEILMQRFRSEMYHIMNEYKNSSDLFKRYYDGIIDYASKTVDYYKIKMIPLFKNLYTYELGFF